MIESPTMARRVAEDLDGHLAGHAYVVRADGDGRLRWDARDGHTETSHRYEPGAGFWRRAFVRLLSWLPIEHLL